MTTLADPSSASPAAAEALRRLGSAAVLQALDQAPLDDEPDDDDLDGQLTEARRDAAEGRGVTADELRHRLRLP
jgi:hypothetical protein